ncbi:general bacterial porin, GBP family [Paraburkholderia kururiensis]|jgi:predicted porin|uniref:porin n=1 Tax=Paraburkholderia kururiensis TaxID=984307 RepID=UPI0018F322F3|nr:porin [Paraburkholderia kururiensis]
MKKIILASAALSLFSSMAQAQSSVTLYGLIDEGFDFTSNVGGERAYQMVSGIAQGSRWGLKGTEDLGGGLSAIFQLENGFDLNNGSLGQGNRMFGRQAYVGISSATAGTLTMGRQYDSVVDYVGPLTANGSWGGQFFSHPFDNDNTDNSFRINNSVKYTSHNYGGVQFGGLYGFSNDPGGTKTNRAWSAGGSYSNGPLNVGAAYLNVNKQARTTFGAVTDGDPFANAGWQRVAAAGVNFTMGLVTLGGVFSYTNVHNILGFPSMIFQNYEVNARYAVTPALSLGAMYDYTHVRQGLESGGVAKGHWHEGGAMADYALSKRTDLYAQVFYQQATGAAGPAWIVGTTGASSGDHQFVGRVGMRHRF